MKKNNYGKFGIEASSYGKARQGFPKEVFNYLKKRTNFFSRLLDVGCGTGISSRQLVNHGFIVVGSDIDKKMIEQAKTDSKNYNIEYIVSSTKKLPFKDKSFEIVTAFSAFHWFCDKKSVSEIKRMLNDNGLFFVINKNETGNLKKIIRSVLINFIPESKVFLDKKIQYKPTLILEKNGFHNIQEYIIPVVEKYTIDNAVIYVKSMSDWNLVIKDKQKEAIKLVKEIMQSIAKNNFVLRPLEIKIVSGSI